MEEFDCVISKSRIGSGEREIQLAQLRMQDFDSKSKKVPPTKERKRSRRRGLEKWVEVNTSVEEEINKRANPNRAAWGPDKYFSAIRQLRATNQINRMISIDYTLFNEQ